LLGLLFDAVCLKSTDVSEEHVASIFRAEEKSEQETSVKAGGKQSFHAVFLLRLLFDPEDGCDMFPLNIV
jgi:hypothetical protein